MVPTRWRYDSQVENHSSLLQNVGRTYLMILTNGILNGNKVSSFIQNVIFIVECIKSLKVICVPMNAIEAGICSFDQSVKQIVENDFEVDFEAKIGLAVLF